MHRAVALALLLALPTGAAGSAAYQVAFVEEETVHELAGTLTAGGAQAFRFPVHDANVTRLDVRLLWEGSSGDVLSLRVVDPAGRAPVPSASGAGGELRVDVGPVAAVPDAATVEADWLVEALDAATSRAGMGDWRLLVESGTGERAAPAAGALSYELEVTVTRFRAVVLSVVTMRGGEGAIDAWQLAAPILAVAALALAVPLARRQDAVRSVVPPGDKTPSSTGEQGRCASER